MPYRLTTSIALSVALTAPVAGHAQENSIIQSFHPEKAAAAKPSGSDRDAAKDQASTRPQTSPAGRDDAASSSAR